MIRIRKGERNEARQDVCNLRRVAAAGSLRNNEGPVSSDTSTGGNSAVGSVQRLEQAGPRRVHVAIVGHKSTHYNPTYNIARNIQKALDPDNPENIAHPVSVTGDASAGGTTVRGRVLETTERGGIHVSVYGGRVWLKEKWVGRAGAGTIRILHTAYKKNRLLSWLRRQHRGRVASLLKMHNEARA